MAGYYGSGNSFSDKIAAEMKERAKKTAKKWLKRILIAIAPFIPAIFVVVMAGAGAMQIFSVFGGIADAIFGSNDVETRVAYEGDLNRLSLDEILTIVENDQLDSSFYRNLMFNRDEFLHLLKSVKEINEDYAAQTISIQVRHTYQEWKEDDTYAANPAAAGGHYETKTEYLDREILEDSRDIEKYQIDWQMVYTMCITKLPITERVWSVSGDAAEGEKVVHYGENYEDIDAAIEACRMKYDYITDLARSAQTSYTLAECKSMVHTPYLYGDPDTEEGEWEYYVPHSVIGSASSAYTTIYYTTTSIEDPETHEVSNYLSNIAEASFMPLYDLTMRRYTYNYDFGYTCDMMALAPGGNKVTEKLEMYRAYESGLGPDENGNAKPGVILWTQELTGYLLPEGYTFEDFPTSTRVVNTGDGNGGSIDFDYSGLEFDEGLAGSFVMAALEKVGCKYSQKLRNEEGYYDCSSLVTRVAKEVGITINGGTAAGIAENLYLAGRVVDPADMKQGDLIFYARKKNGLWVQPGRFMRISHVSIYMGDGRQVHARNEKYGVSVNNYTGSEMVLICRPPY